MPETDLISSLKNKLITFRIKELKDVLTQLGLAKQGKKQDLVDRIMSSISIEGPGPHCWSKKNAMEKEMVAKIIDDTYRKMQLNGATDLASKQSSGLISNVKGIEKGLDSSPLGMRTHCFCGSSLHTGSMIQCEDPRCHTWQHLACVVIAEKFTEDAQAEIPSPFFCEICRLNRADPFWATLSHPLAPLKLTPLDILPEGGNSIHTVERTFTLNRCDRDLLQKAEYDLQAWCILLNDKVQFRMQWPLHADLQVNGVPVRTTNRPGSQALGINGRDDGPAITTCSREGLNRIFFSARDARIFCFGVRIVRRRTLERVLDLVPKDCGETLEEAVARARRCIAGGEANDEHSDSDLEVVSDSVVVSLRCPMSGSRIKIAGRFKPCIHMGCFDLESFVGLCQRSRKWQCPICLRNFPLEQLIVDPFFNRICSMLKNCGEDVNEVEVKPDGSWRAKNENEHKDLAQWHSPDGSLCCVRDVRTKPADSGLLKQVKQEGYSDVHVPLKLGIKRNRKGEWEVSKANYPQLPFSGDKIGCNNDSSREFEEPSVDHKVDVHSGSLTANDSASELISLKVPSLSGAPISVTEAPAVIVLSDSEEENVHLSSTEVAYSTDHGAEDVLPPPVVSFSDAAGPSTVNPGLELFSSYDEFLGLPLWSLPQTTSMDQGFQFFGPEPHVQEPSLTMQHASNTDANSYVLDTSENLMPFQHVADSFGCRIDIDANGTLVDNTLMFYGDDPSLKNFLPTCPSLKPGIRESADVPIISHTADWLSLGGSVLDESSRPVGELNMAERLPVERDTDSVAEAASLLLGMNEGRSENSTKHHASSGGHFSQQRSVRPRVNFSMDADSE